MRWMPRFTCSSTSPGAVALEQLDLQVVQRIEVREAVADRARERRIGFEEADAAGDREERPHGGIELGADAREDRLAERRVGHAGPCSARRPRGRPWRAACRGWRASRGRTATSRHISCEQLPALPRRGAATNDSHRAAEAVPARQHHAALRPREHPRDRAQVLDALRGLARGGARADVELGDLADRRGGAEVVDEARRSRTRGRDRPRMRVARELVHRRVEVVVLGVRARRRASRAPSRRPAPRGCAGRSRGWRTCSR